MLINPLNPVTSNVSEFSHGQQSISSKKFATHSWLKYNPPLNFLFLTAISKITADSTILNVFSVIKEENLKKSNKTTKFYNIPIFIEPTTK
ncbi:hypothetical protein [Methanobrevibacter sp.]|uniref:hypothetical protein n=1 Tax=Methanobrevibacter sp. TaxID=66852 RepID=UPI00386E2EE0